ncbi:MAG TPA: MarC family protein [Acidimicrobiales bacterium]|jgi:multiple antibiotic resistance protein
MDFTSINAAVVIDIFLLLLIGIGPKIALVPFLNVTEGMDQATKNRVIRKMLTSATSIALALFVFGELLTRLLHFSTGSLAIAGGIILLIIAVSMVLHSDDSEPDRGAIKDTDPMRVAVFPLAVPYLLNPAGITVIVIISAEARPVALSAIVIGLLALVILLDVVVFRWAGRVAAHLDPSRMLLTEKVFGFLLAALGVQLVLHGLDDVGVIHLLGH